MTGTTSPPGGDQMLLYRAANAAVAVFAPLLTPEQRETALAELRVALRPVLDVFLWKLSPLEERQ